MLQYLTQKRRGRRRRTSSSARVFGYAGIRSTTEDKAGKIHKTINLEERERVRPHPRKNSSKALNRKKG